VASAAPWLSTVFLITTLASIGLPMLNNFVGEFLVLQGAAIANFRWAIYASIGVILSACYMLWLYQRVFYGETSAEVRAHVPDLNLREWAAVVPLIVMMVWMGVYSQSFLAPVSKTTARVLAQSEINVPFQVRNEGRLRRAGFQPAMSASLPTFLSRPPIESPPAPKNAPGSGWKPALRAEASNAR
jgi:NADH-quinone oxidoreductase subunit M